MAVIGRHISTIASGPGNPRNGEGAFYELPNGDIHFAYTRFVGESHGDDGHSCIARRVSKDRGETWSEDEILFRTEDHNAINIMSISFLKMQNGDVGIFYLVRYGMHDTRLHLSCSADQGRTWSEAVACIPAPGYYVTNNDRVIRLASGRILVPANLHRMKNFDKVSLEGFDGRAIPIMFYSDDDGVSWQEGSGYCMATLPGTRTLLQESGVIEKQDGTVYQWMRTDRGSQYEAISVDEGDTWSTPVPSRFTSPASPMSMKRNPYNGQLVAIWNPIPPTAGLGKVYGFSTRTPFVVATSGDDGKTWSDYACFEDDPGYAYCYAAMHFTKDEHLLISYMKLKPGAYNSEIKKIHFSELPTV